jgi:hypothetical protein
MKGVAVRWPYRFHGGNLLHVPHLRGAQVLQGAPHATVLQVPLLTSGFSLNKHLKFKR